MYFAILRYDQKVANTRTNAITARVCAQCLD